MSGECDVCHFVKFDDKENQYKIDIGYQSVIVDKMFGPLIFANLRITADPKTNYWIIEREFIKTGGWIEWIRIPGQIDVEFSDNEDGFK